MHETSVSFLEMTGDQYNSSVQFSFLEISLMTSGHPNLHGKSMLFSATFKSVTEFTDHHICSTALGADGHPNEMSIPSLD